jgi:hypothetical protein
MGSDACIMGALTVAEDMPIEHVSQETMFYRTLPLPGFALIPSSLLMPQIGASSESRERLRVHKRAKPAFTLSTRSELRRKGSRRNAARHGAGVGAFGVGT